MLRLPDQGQMKLAAGNLPVARILLFFRSGITLFQNIMNDCKKKSLKHETAIYLPDCN